jgi:hypothetical protein
MTMTLKEVLIIDRESRMIFRNTLKSHPVLCCLHHSYIWYRDKGGGSCYCKKGEHSIFCDPELFQLVEI